MPIRIFSLPVKVIQYALRCMDIYDFIAVSLCSKRAKNLAESSNRKIESITAEVYERLICFDVFPKTPPGFSRLPRKRIILHREIDFYIDVSGKNRTEVLKREEYTQGDWFAHFLSIFNEPKISVLVIQKVSPSYLDAVIEFVPKCNRLEISYNCSNEISQKAVLKLAPRAKEVGVHKNIFDRENDIGQFLNLNLRSMSFHDLELPFKLTLDDLLVVNITNLSIENATITEKDLN